MRSPRAVVVAVVLLGAAGAPPSAAGDSDTLQFLGNELLGRPTDRSITIHACATRALEVYYEYGTDSVNYVNRTAVLSTADSIPFVCTLTSLLPDTRYFYRMRYRLLGSSTYLVRSSHTFHTARSRGSTFTFAVEADPHMDSNSVPAVYALTLQNILARRPDFLVDLGDTFMSEKLAVITPAAIRDRHLLLRSYFDIATHSVPLFLALGNHEGELGWRLDSTADNLPVWASKARTTYFPNPLPDTVFYSGNTRPEPYVGLRQNYYAWEWGDALFVVLDPYWYTKRKPGWWWTLGADQFAWFRNVITSSRARFRFVFCHQLVGGNGNDARGGAEFAHLFEMGGRNADSTWGFDANRPGWGGMPVHALMAQNSPAVFFHGHDHFFGMQRKDGVVYQEVPQPSLRSFTTLPAAEYGYVNGVFIPSRGFLLVTVSETHARVEYIRTYLPSEENASRRNGQVSYSYTIDTAGTVTGVTASATLPDDVALEQNYPNPFNPGTTIRYQLPRAAHVQLKVYDLLGREVVTLVDRRQEAGIHAESFVATTYALPSGIYFCRLAADGGSRVVSMVYVK